MRCRADLWRQYPEGEGAFKHSSRSFDNCPLGAYTKPTHTKSHILWTGLRPYKDGLRGHHRYTTSYFATLASSKLCFALGWVSLSNTLIANCKDQADLGNPKQKTHHPALATSSPL